ncbi:putative quinol monooxygenase [Microvirga sp. TS319]|uniref:putative quinol monooxygenase n=1 Tax=Microvirga sp. TS319 TaxID=3241165 RepID=UPI00351A49BB
MNKAALLITHRTLPGKRDEVRHVWEKHLKPNIASNPAHEAYFYCYDDKDPDVILAFQQYTDRISPQDFVRAPWYAAYIEEVTPLIAGEPDVRAVTPVWAKGGLI